MNVLANRPMILPLIATCFLSPTVSRSADDAPTAYAAWEAHRDAVKASPDLLRYYTFQTISAESSSVPSLGRESEPLEYISDEPPVVVPGRWPEKRAVRLDRGFFQAKPFEVEDSSFTVEMSFRKLGQGAHLGNGRTNGALFALGDGYWSGSRVWTDYPTRRLHFEIGRPKPSHSFGLSSGEPAPDGVWSHLAASWDGRQMRIYLNGVLLEAADYSGDYSPGGGSFRVGFANAGIGSVRMDVDEVAVFARALSPGEVFRHAYCMAELRPDWESRLTAATEAVADDNWPVAVERFSQLVDLPDVDPTVRAAARLGLAGALRRQNRASEAVAQYVTLFDDEQTPEAIRQTALRHCIPVDHGAVRAAASRSAYERLVEMPDLSAAQRIDVRLSLAESCLREGDAAGARREYAAVLESADLPAAAAWDVRLQMAHAYLSEKDYPQARVEYETLAEDADAPREIRGMALLCVGHALLRERAYPAAAASFEAAAARDDLLPHHRQEARGRAREARRLAEGLPAVDPQTGRTEIPPEPKPGVIFYVSPNGDDAAAGTLEGPFAGLTQARDAIREIQAAGGLASGGATVFVRGGTYAVRETFVLTEVDSGAADAPIIYRAFPGEEPRFSGGVTLKGFTPVVDQAVLARFSENVRPHVVQLNLRSIGITDLGQITARGYGRAGYPTSPWVDLYVNGRPMQLARWPNVKKGTGSEPLPRNPTSNGRRSVPVPLFRGPANNGFIKTGPVDQGAFRTDQANRPGRFQFDDPRPTAWQAADDIWMFGYWGHLWAGRFVRVDRIDSEKQTITTAGPASYGFRPGMPYYYFNVLEELDQPGEWYLDRKSGVLYLYPPESVGNQLSSGSHRRQTVEAEDARALASVATVPMQVQIPLLNGPLLVARDVSHVTLRGLTFELGRTEGAVILGGEKNLLAGCTLRRLGGNGVIVQGGQGHGLLGCDIHTLGAGGVRMVGGDRRTLTPGGHFVENCHVYDFTRVDRVYAPAVHLDGVGNRIAHNLFHDSPHHGMRVEGYQQVIEFNEIHSVVYESDDQAGIDMFGNPAYRGNVIRYNFWHHIGSGHNVAGQAGIRLDDQISGTLVAGNVFYRCSGGQFGGVQIHGGKDNIVENNLFIDCKYAVSFSAWGEKRWLERLRDERTRATLARDGVLTPGSPHLARYGELARLEENADRNFIRRNLAVQCGPFAARDGGRNQMLDNHVWLTDPGFADASGRDFTLPDDCPVYDRFDFRPIPFAQIGLYDDDRRATWPVEHVRVAGIVLKWIRGDKEANFRRIEPMIREAARGGARIVVTTECSLDGYAIADKSIPLEVYRNLGETIPGGEYYRRLAALAAELKIHLVAGMMEADGEQRYNTAVLIGPDGRLIGKYRKQKLGHESVRNTPGDASLVFSSPYGRVGLMICADRTEQTIVGRFRDNGAEWMICPSGGMFGSKTNDPIVQARSRENGMHIIFVHPAEFLVTGPDGSILARTILGDRLLIEPQESGGETDRNRVFYFDLPQTPENETGQIQPAETSREKVPIRADLNPVIGPFSGARIVFRIVRL